MNTGDEPGGDGAGTMNNDNEGAEGTPPLTQKKTTEPISVNEKKKNQVFQYFKIVLIC